MHEIISLWLSNRGFWSVNYSKTSALQPNVFMYAVFTWVAFGLGLTNGWKLERTSVLLMIALVMLGNCFGGIGYDR